MVEKERVRDERPKVAGVILVVILPLKRPFCLVETLSVAGLTLCVHVLLARTPLTTSKTVFQDGAIRAPLESVARFLVHLLGGK